MSVVGKSVRRNDAREKAEGRTQYIADIAVPNMLYAATVRSPYARARILSVKSGSVKEMPGLHAVVTAKDIPGKNVVPVVTDDMPLLAENEVRYVGEPIALVAAEQETIAWLALTQIEVQYQQLPELTDFRVAREPDAVQLYKDNNTFSYHRIRRGDVARAEADCAAIVEQIYETPYQEHGYLEPQGMLAIPHSDGSLEILGSMQCPFYIQEAITVITGLPRSKVIIKQAATGGAFGGKEDVPSIVAGHVAVLALKTQQPVRIVYRRDEDFIAMSKRHPSRVKLRMGCDAQGGLSFISGEVLLDGGAYATLSPVVLWRSVVHTTGAYRCDNIHIDGYAVCTNNVPTGAFRGFGSPQSLFAVESLIDELAYNMHLDPLEFRWLNRIEDGVKTGTGQLITGSCGLGETIVRAKDASDWKNQKQINRDNDSAIKKGIGISTIFYGVGLGAGGKHLARTGAFLQIMIDGSVQIAVGTTELGQGMRTVLAQIAADGLGVRYEDVFVIDTDSSRVPDSGPTVASRATTMSGRAILDACKQATNVMTLVAADLLGVNCEQVLIVNGIFKTNNDSNQLSTKEVIVECHRRCLPMAFQGFSVSPQTDWNADTGTGHAYVVYAYATNIAQVAVDTRTGEVIVDKIIAAHDVGKAVNPQTVEGQIEGGTIQGLGFCLMEGYRLKNGKALNPDFSTYQLPCSVDSPKIVPIIVEHEYDNGPFGAKGFGEQPLMGVAPAITNAIFDAIGVRFRSLPVTPEKVYFKIKNEKKNEK